jgi:hypothetical protein
LVKFFLPPKRNPPEFINQNLNKNKKILKFDFSKHYVRIPASKPSFDDILQAAVAQMVERIHGGASLPAP